MDETLLDFEIVCLVCLCTKEKFNSIFNNDPETPDMQIYEKISCSSNLKLPENLLQKVPNKICTICLQELGTTWRFRKKCEAANKIFQSMLKPELEAEQMVKLTLEEYKLKLPPGIKVKCVNSMPHTLTAPKMPTNPTKEIEKGEPSIDQENLPLAMSTTPKLNDEESNMNSHPLSLSGDVLDFGNISTVNEFMSIDDIEAAEDSAATQHIEYVYEAEYFDDTNQDTLPISMSPSRDGKEYPSVAVSVAKHTKDNIYTIEIAPSTPPINPETVLTTELKLLDHGSQAEQTKTQNICANKTTNITNDITTRSKTSAAFQSVQPVQLDQQRETTLQKQNKKTDKDKNSPSSHLKATNDDKNIELSLSKPNKGRAKSGTTAQAKICNICGNTYKYQHALKAHMRRHCNEKPFPCEVCEKAFVSNVELRRHMRVHTGQKPYGCQFCTRRFSDFGSSKKHERIHTGERPYVCEVCYKGFAYAHVLTEHRRIHTGQKKYPCPTCGIGFTKKVYLQAHEKYKCKTRLHNNRANKQNGHHNIDDNIEIINGLTGLNDANMDNLHVTSMEDGDGGDDMRSVFDDNKVLEECIVESEFISDSLDDDCLPHAAPGNNKSDEGGSGSGVYPLIINTEFSEAYNTE